MSDFAQLSAHLPRFNEHMASFQHPLLRSYQTYYSSKLGVEVPTNDVTHRIGTLNVDNYQIVVQSWMPKAPRATLFLAHGYWDHVGMGARLIELALSQQLAVVAWDAPGHGLSSGQPAAIDRFATYDLVMRHVLRHCTQMPRPWIGCGHSTGGAVLLHYWLASRGDVFQQGILLAPLIRPQSHRRICLGYALGKHFLRRVKRSGWYTSSHDRAFCDVVRHDPLQVNYASVKWVGAMCHWAEMAPKLLSSSTTLLCIQGTADATVDWRYNLKLLQDKFPQLSQNIIPDARHHLANESDPWRSLVNTSLIRCWNSAIGRYKAQNLRS